MGVGMVGGVSFSEKGGWWVVAQAPLVVLAAVVSPWTARGDAGFGHPLQWIGFALVAIGLLVACAGVVALGRWLTPFTQPRARARLVTGGVFGRVRNPIYTGLVVAALGWALAWLSVAGVALAVLLAVFLDRKARREERWLRERFPEYAAYARRVRRFIPRVY